MPKKRARSLRRLLKLHRTLGLISAGFVVCLAVSGLMLQHTSRLGLDSSYLTADFWLHWYDLEAPLPERGFFIDDHLVALVVDRIYFDFREIQDGTGSLIGLVPYEGLYLIATSEGLILVTPGGDAVERFTALHGVPLPLEALGNATDGAVVISSSSQNFHVDLENLRFPVAASLPTTVSWSRSEALSDVDASELSRRYADSLLSVERLVLDLHSGRLLGRWGVLLMDFMAVSFIVMAASGIWIWGRRRRKHS